MSVAGTTTTTTTTTTTVETRGWEACTFVSAPRRRGCGDDDDDDDDDGGRHTRVSEGRSRRPTFGRAERDVTTADCHVVSEFSPLGLALSRRNDDWPALLVRPNALYLVAQERRLVCTPRSSQRALPCRAGTTTGLHDSFVVTRFTLSSRNDWSTGPGAATPVVSKQARGPERAAHGDSSSSLFAARETRDD